MTELDELRNGLSAGDPDARARCAENLARLAGDAAPAAVDLVRAVDDRHETVREWVVAALESLGAPPVAAVPELIMAALAERADVAYWAVTLLGRLGDEGAAAVPTLVSLLDSTSPVAVRHRAAWALGEIGPAAETARGELSAASETDDPRLTRLAATALERIAG